MQISTSEAVKLGFVLKRDGSKMDAVQYIDRSSFDLSVRDVLVKDRIYEKVVEERGYIIVKPQESVYLVSEQLVNVPDGYVAYVFLKNRMSNKGLLALNTGIVDQGYYGPISTLVVNLSKGNVVVPTLGNAQETAFFRVVFHSISDESKKPIFSGRLRSYEEYVENRKKELSRFPDDFMDRNEIKEAVSERLEQKTNQLSLKRLSMLIALLGILFSLLPLVKDYALGKMLNIEEVSSKLQKVESENKYLKEEIDLLKLDVKDLR